MSHNNLVKSLPRCSKVLILNPSVGEIWSIGSPLNLFNIVVFPALSSPLLKKLKKLADVPNKQNI